MEDKLHNDRLEAFLRRSLEGHSEEPPSDMWAKIAGGLDAAPPTPNILPNAPKVRFLSKWWAATAAAAVVLGLFVVQHLYFEKKIEKLTKDLEQATVQVQQQESNDQHHNSTIKNSDTTPAPINEAIKETTLNKSETAVSKENKAALLTPAPANKSSKSSLPDKVKKQEKSSATELPSQPQEGIAVEQQKFDPAPDAQDKDGKSENLVESVKQTDHTGLEKIWAKPINLSQPVAASSPLAKSFLPIEPIKNRSRITVGINAMPMVSRSKIHSVSRDSSEPGKPFEKKSFDVDVENSGQAWLAGITLEAAITPRLNIGSGLGYRTLKYESSHELCLDFKDKKKGPPGTPHNDHEHDFQYELNTGVGSIEMEVRAETDEIAQNIPDDEKIEAEVKTSQELSYVTVPFYANYAFGKGRLRAIAKGGIMMNFLQSHEFSVDEIRPINEKFSFSHREGQRGTQSDLQTVSVDYMVGIGMEYRLANNMSLRLEPTVVGALTSTHNNPRIESSEIAAGLNLGLTYSF